MKRFLLIPSYALLALGILASCQKEEKTVTELAQELTGTLQKITDYKSAEANAPRVEVLNKRLQDAGVRVFALNDTALLRAAGSTEGSEGAEYVECLEKLATEIARVQAALPGTTEGGVEEEKLVMAVGAAHGAGDASPAAARREKGVEFYQNPVESAKEPGNFSEFYGSSRLKEALSYTADPASVGLFQMDDEVEAVPEAAAVSDDEPEASDAPAAADEPAATDDSSEGVVPSAVEEPADASEEPASTTTLDDELPSLDLDGDSSSSDGDSSSSDGDESGSDDFGLDLDF